MGCPYDGEQPIEAVRYVARCFHSMGCYEISLIDTIGLGTKSETQKLIEGVSSDIPLDKIVVHFHDTHHHALENILAAMDMGVSIIDSSIAGLGA
jgi:hydroxymethylglutaryl-CoA lyase